MKVGVVGLGAAGLRAAMLLRQAGVDLHLFEARDRVGGRLHTIPLEGGGFIEAGGEWIDSDHHRVLSLLTELGQAPEPSDQWPGRVFHDGQWCREDALWEDVAESVELLEARARQACAELNPVPWLNLDRKDWDSTPISQWFDECTTSHRARWWLEALTKSDEGDSSDRISILGWLAGYRHYLDRQGGEMSALRMPQGGQGLCQAMLQQIGLEPHFDCPLERVEHSDSGVRLLFADRIEDFDAVILTLPPWPLRKVEFEPRLPREKVFALQRIGMSPSVKVAWRFREPFWKDLHGSGRLIANRVFQQVWDGSRGGQDFVLMAYVNGDDALWLNHEKLGDRVVDWLFDEFTEVVPEARPHYLGGTIYDWARDRWAEGSFSHLKPRFVLGGMEHVGTPVGRLFFAGEHTALWTGFIEGALESAERVAEEVKKCLG
ncbi:MAG TPA: NAD(P)/FAD-dependent oxidoreductase [Fimbriimonadaceae bacterium]|nr:NAD(P)/FAD-dependent oxidoreductase [Fimbriimonadaceae bacterium]HRJ32100.1 NAD(P)/FAD-dependent oxidoreductase [Fimbriimonadaceae bacterium]